jgi:L-aspartate oxidase
LEKYDFANLSKYIHLQSCNHKYPVFLDLRKTDFEYLYPFLNNKLKHYNKVIPVQVVQHYCFGGIFTNEFGQTNVQGLYALGECAACKHVEYQNILKDILVGIENIDIHLDTYYTTLPVSLNIDTHNLESMCIIDKDDIEKYKKSIQNINNAFMYKPDSRNKCVNNICKIQDKIEDSISIIDDDYRQNVETIELKNMITVSKLLINM